MTFEEAVASMDRAFRLAPDATTSPSPEVLERIAAALERIADQLERGNERAGYDSALARWRAGQGKHPDD